jgi:hypothetical protein
MLKLKGAPCPQCGQDVPVWALVRCPICGREVCHRCAYRVYGRQFCSPDCGMYFVTGDAESDVEDEEETDKAEG